jgi:beta-lactamase class A
VRGYIKTDSSPMLERRNKPKRQRNSPLGQQLLKYFLLVLLLLASPVACLPTGISSTSAVIFPNQSDTVTTALPPFLMSQHLTDTETAIAAVANQPGLDAGVFAIEPDTGNYIDVNGHKTYSAASMIKLPVMVALLSAIDLHKVSMEQILTLRPELIGGGSGMLQWRPLGSKVPLKQAAELMLVISDNTATNLIIDLLGGKECINKELESWGLTHTRINNFLPDLEGTNYTSPYDLIFLLGRIKRGEILSPESRQYLFSIMERCHTRTLLPHCLLPGDAIAHKTGDIGSMVGDAGLITTHTGKQYFIAVQVKRPHNDLRANELVRVISAIVYSKIVGQDCGCSKTFVPPVAVYHTSRVRRHCLHNRNHHSVTH